MKPISERHAYALRYERNDRRLTQLRGNGSVCAPTASHPHGLAPSRQQGSERRGGTLQDTPSLRSGQRLHARFHFGARAPQQVLRAQTPGSCCGSGGPARAGLRAPRSVQAPRHHHEPRVPPHPLHPARRFARARAPTHICTLACTRAHAGRHTLSLALTKEEEQELPYFAVSSPLWGCSQPGRRGARPPPPTTTSSTSTPPPRRQRLTPRQWEPRPPRLARSTAGGRQKLRRRRRPRGQGVSLIDGRRVCARRPPAREPGGAAPGQRRGTPAPRASAGPAGIRECSICSLLIGLLRAGRALAGALHSPHSFASRGPGLQTPVGTSPGSPPPRRPAAPEPRASPLCVWGLCGEPEILGHPLFRGEGDGQQG